MAFIQEIEYRDNGSARLQIDNQWFTAWPPLAGKVKNFAKGDSVSITFDTKESGGKLFKNLKSIESVAGGKSQVNTPSKSYKDPLEENLMMLTRYALDSMPERPAKSPEQAVDLVYDIVNRFRAKLVKKETVSQSQG